MARSSIRWRRRQSARPGDWDDEPWVSPYRRFDRRVEDAERMLGLAFDPGERYGPQIDVAEDEQAVHVTAELPGFTAKDVELDYAGNALAIRGHKKQEREESGRHYHRRERGSGSFTRVVSMPCAIDPERIKATFADGVLTIELAKTEAARARVRSIPARTS